ncbi:MAG: hypothetical protein E7647_04775 [Ruminococcaceae bacterium]|nr:hypothetical protein [Oscillospiraceae bacterium]
MKRILALIFAFVLAIGALNSCIGDKNELIESEEKEEIKEKEENKETEIAEDTKPEVEIELLDDFCDASLLPMIITKERFEKEILSSIKDDEEKARFETFYTLYDISDPDYNDKLIDLVIVSFPAAEKRAVYVRSNDMATIEIDYLIGIMSKHLPDYTHEDLAYDYYLCGYTQEDFLNGLVPFEKGSLDS